MERMCVWLVVTRDVLILRRSCCVSCAGATFTRDNRMTAALYGAAKQALPEDVLGGRVELPEEVRCAHAVS